ncbi:MAG: hypothetical protein WBA63_14620 [Thermomicrobiales bacterium]
MPADSPPSHHPSPLDGAIARLLLVLQEQPASGSLSAKRMSEIADRLDVPVPFVQALVQSAQRRKLVKPGYLGRGRIVWHVTASGVDLIHRQGLAHGRATAADD